MSRTLDLVVPDIGDFSDVPVIEVSIAPGDVVRVDDTLVTLESEKATMEVPATAAGVVAEVKVKPGDRVSAGSVLASLTLAEAAASAPADFLADEKNAAAAPVSPPATPAPALQQEVPAASLPAPGSAPGRLAHASPSVRAYARELGVDLAQVVASGPKGRILREDVTAFVKRTLTAPSVTPAAAASGGGLTLAPWPQVDFARFGEIERKPLSRIQKISGANLARNWVMIPAVTYHEEADISDLEDLRLLLNREHAKVPDAPKLTLLAFLLKACVKALQRYPELNASLDGDELVLKRYVHLGFAADTPNGLVVPVIRDADRKGVLALAAESGELASRARAGALKPAEMQGASFTVSSLGGIGGTAFSPIVNAPEVAILGVSKVQTKPQWDGAAFVPRRMLPLSLSADHRVIDGALATRFLAHLAQLLQDFRRVAL